MTGILPEELIVDNFAGGGGGARFSAIDAVRLYISKGVLEIKPNGQFWKIARLTNRGSVVPSMPRRAEVRLKNGYLGITSWVAGKPYLIQAHKAVWILLVGPIHQGLDVNHKDGNKANNHPNNLEIVTRSENLKHAYRTGLRKSNAVVSTLAAEARHLRSQGLAFSQIGLRLGVSQTTAFRAAQYKPELNHEV